MIALLGVFAFIVGCVLLTMFVMGSIFVGVLLLEVYDDARARRLRR